MTPAKAIVRMRNRAFALWKRCLSYRKHDWELSDYPVVFRTQECDPSSAYKAPRFKLKRYLASIVNWHITGMGDSRSEAMQDLSDTFVATKAKKREMGRTLPRSGTEAPIEFASQERVNAHAEIADDFIDHILELDSAWISDESSLWDFHTDENNASYVAKIREIYGVDVSDIDSANLAEILERIASTQKPALT
jgi:hypothetical protein